MNIYQENGFSSRKDYLKCLSDEYGVPFDTVVTMALLLGKDEDFDGLVCELEDMSYAYCR